MSETTQTAEREDVTDFEVNDPRAAVRAARALVPVGRGGFNNLQEQVDYAQSMAKAKVAMPAHLRGNIGDCLAIIDIAQRAGLSPYMVANHTYVQSGKLCFESQLYHAFLQSSGLLKGDLEVEWRGEGGERVCIITGILKSDPDRPKETKSLPLKDRHPGYVLKKRYDDGSDGKTYLTYAAGEKLRAEGGIADGMKLFSQGSPLWITKIDLAQFYDTTRDWSRMWAPRATMGIYTIDEMQDFADDMRDVTPPTGSGLTGRLKAETVDRTEGHGAADPQKEIDNAKNGGPAPADDEHEEPKIGPETLIVDVGFKSATATALTKDGLKTLADLLQMTEAAVADMRGVGDTALKDIKETVGKLGFVLQTSSEEASAALQAKAEEAPQDPRNPKEWDAYARDWIGKSTDYKTARTRWKNEMALRNNCGVVSAENQPVRELLDAKCKELGEPQ